MTIRRINIIHYLSLAGAIAFGAMLRFWHLDLKPLWMDEVITAIFSLGKNYHDLPLNVMFPLNRVQDIFTFKSGVSCAEIAANVATQSTHPPLFFCGMHSWLGWMLPLGQEWVEKLRSLPALFGVGAIVAIYGVNRIAFSPSSGILAAVVMAVSPFAVYLSQEARHYTMPMFLITLALLGLMQIQRDIFERSQIRWWVWLLWAIINSIGLYVHYFFALAFIAEIATLLLLIQQSKINVLIQRQIWLALIISTTGVVISFIPWLLVIFNHVQRSETSWLPTPNYIAPFYQILINWTLMVIALPVENQSLPVAGFCGFLMVMFAIWAGWQVFQGLKILSGQNTSSVSTFTLLSFTSFVILQFIVIVYLFKKDITIVPRYHFVYYPGFCALIAASIGKRQKSQLIILFAGILSCVFVVSNLVFQKPFQPEQVAKNMNFEPSVPIMLVVEYSNYQDVALGLSFALSLKKVRNQSVSEKLKSHNLRDQSRGFNLAINTDKVAFLEQYPNLSAVWKKLSQLPSPRVSQINLWVVAPGIRRRDYPEHLEVAGTKTCIIDPTQHYRIGVPYQLYRCK